MSSITIREKVTRAVNSKAFDRFDTSTLVTLVITAFLEAAAEQGWHMRPDEATEEMAVAGCRHENMGDMAGRYGAMLAASPEFEWDKKVSAKPGKPPSGGL